jgi:hypothetical protein
MPEITLTTVVDALVAICNAATARGEKLTVPEMFARVKVSESATITTAKSGSPPGYASVAEFAKMMGVSKSTVYRWIAAGMPVVRLPRLSTKSDTEGQA